MPAGWLALGVATVLAAPACSELLGVEDWEGAVGSTSASSGVGTGSGGAGGGLCAACPETVAWATTFGDLQDDQGFDVALDDAGNVYVTGYFNGSVHLGAENLAPFAGMDAFAAKLDPAGKVLWAKAYGGVGDDYGSRILPSPSGGVVLIGVTNSATIDLGAGTGTLVDVMGAQAGFVVVLDAAGAETGDFALVDGFASTVTVTGALDSDGNIFLTGGFDKDTAVAGGVPLVPNGLHDVLVAKLDPTAHHLWSTSFGGEGFERGRAITVGADGGPVVAGATNEDMDFGAGPIMSAGGSDAFVAKLGPDGAHVWSALFGGVGDESIEAVVVTAAGDVLLGGNTSGTLTVGPSTIGGGGGEDAFLIKLDASGGPVWARSFGAAENQLLSGVAAGPAGDAWLIGAFRGAIPLETGSLMSSTTTNDLYLIHLGPDGSPLCGKQFGGAGDEATGAVAVGACGVAFTGAFSEQIELGKLNKLKTSNGDFDGLVARLVGP